MAETDEVATSQDVTATTLHDATMMTDGVVHQEAVTETTEAETMIARLAEITMTEHLDVTTMTGNLLDVITTEETMNHEGIDGTRSHEGKDGTTAETMHLEDIRRCLAFYSIYPIAADPGTRKLTALIPRLSVVDCRV